jgi:hypothetical protein
VTWTSADSSGGDAAFARPELYEYLEPEGYLYAIRLPANDVLQREIEPLLTGAAYNLLRMPRLEAVP